MGRGSVPSRVLVVLSLVAALAAFATRADAGGRIACGSVLTSSVTLHHDLLHCPGDGLVIGADDIVVDLGGHRIVGSDNLVDHKGLRLEGHTGVVVKNGIVHKFYDDVYLHNETLSVVKTLHLTVATYPIHLCSSSYNTIARNVIGAAFNAGIILNCTTNSNNDIRRNALHNDGVGIQLEETASNTIEYNTISKPTTGVFANVNSASDLIRHNTIIGARSSGILVTGNNSELDSNVVRHAGIGIEVGSNSSGTYLIGNRTNRSANQGILVRGSTTATTVDRNIAKHNGADGIEIDADETATSVGSSVADYNHAWGIDIALDVTDGDGNEAHGNTTPGQCTLPLHCRIG